MPEAPFTTAKEDEQHHTYTTHRIPWYVRAMWLGFWVALIWYIIAFAIPSAKDYYKPVNSGSDARASSRSSIVA